VDEALITAVKAVNGGLFVAAFALVAEVAEPKRFAGLFSAAPSIALANLIVIAVAMSTNDAQQQSTGMIVGAIALVGACAVGLHLIGRWRALRGSLGVCGVWLALTLGLGVAFL
jgi:hypothetical protein